jgi:hypothetical protein
VEHQGFFIQVFKDLDELVIILHTPLVRDIIVKILPWSRRVSGQDKVLIRASRDSRVKRLAPADRFDKKVFEFFSGFAPDINVVIRAKQAGLEFAIRGDAEAVAVRTELGIVERPDNFNFGTVETIFFPVVHAAGDDLSGP